VGETNIKICKTCRAALKHGKKSVTESGVTTA
jgi:hypothetical protein